MTDHLKTAQNYSEVRNRFDGFVSSLSLSDDQSKEATDIRQAMLDVEKKHVQAHEDAHKPSKAEQKAMDTPTHVDEPEPIAILNAEANRSPAGVIEKAQKPGGQDVNNATSIVNDPSLGEAHKESEEKVHHTPANAAKLGDPEPQVNQTEDELKPEPKHLDLATKAAEKGAEDSKKAAESIRTSEDKAKAEVKSEGDKKLVGTKGKSL